MVCACRIELLQREDISTRERKKRGEVHEADVETIIVVASSLEIQHCACDSRTKRAGIARTEFHNRAFHALARLNALI